MVAWESGVGALDRRDIAAVERRWGVRFPDAFVRVCLEAHGGRPRPNTIDIPSREGVVLDSLLTFSSAAPRAALRTYERIGEYLPQRVSPFAFTPSGDIFRFDFRRSAEPSIVLWHHEEATKRPVKVAASFGALVDRLYDTDESEIDALGVGDLT